VKLPEGSEGRPSFGRKPKDGNKFIKPPEVKLLSETSSASYRKPPEVKLPEGKRERV